MYRGFNIQGSFPSILYSIPECLKMSIFWLGKTIAKKWWVREIEKNMTESYYIIDCHAFF